MKKLWIIGAIAIGGLAFAFYKFSRFDAEAAPYEVRLKEGRFELRRYPRLMVARTEMQGRDDSFQRLFKFISGENQRSQKIAMTTPVLFEGEPGRSQTMSFIMPAAVQRAGAPEPSGNAVALDERASTDIAALRFWSGMKEEAETRAFKELRDWVKDRGLEPEGDPIVAYYDAPFIPAPLRRNEVMLRVKTGR